MEYKKGRIEIKKIDNPVNEDEFVMSIVCEDNEKLNLFYTKKDIEDLQEVAKQILSN